MIVTILDTKTGQKATSANTQFDNRNIYFWTEGNGGCDCNRVYLFDESINDEMDAEMRKENPELEEWQSYCYREKRFLIINVEPMPEGYVLRDFNNGYPKELIKKYLGK